MLNPYPYSIYLLQSILDSILAELEYLLMFLRFWINLIDTLNSLTDFYSFLPVYIAIFPIYFPQYNYDKLSF